MKIVDRATFLALPAGTVFMKFPAQPSDGKTTDLGYDPILEIKGDTLGSDYVTMDLCPWFETTSDDRDFSDSLIAALRGEETPPFDYDCGGRDGLFDEDQLFAVWSLEDHRRLIAALQSALDTRMSAAELPA